MATIDLAAYEERVERGLITKRKHPTEDLYIWNYTPRCTYDRAWDEVTMQARGLITTGDGTIKARPFAKFFNYGERDEPLPNEPFTVTEKMDGCLGVLYFIGDTPHIATRGSFTSWQAIRATKILHENYIGLEFMQDKTYLFEVIMPQGRIVVDYGEMEDLVLLAIINTETGEEYSIHSPYPIWPFPVVKRYTFPPIIGSADIPRLSSLVSSFSEENREGFVVRFESGLRLKMKFEEYLRLHRIITQTSARVVWEHLREQRSFIELYERVPPEFAAWVKQTSKDLYSRYLAIHKKVEEVYKETMEQTSIPVPFVIGTSLVAKDYKRLHGAMQKAIQERFAAYPDVEHFLLLRYNGTKYHFPNGKFAVGKEAIRLAIWDSLYPEYSRPFRIEEEAV